MNRSKVWDMKHEDGSALTTEERILFLIGEISSSLKVTANRMMEIEGAMKTLSQRLEDIASQRFEE